MIEIYTAEVNTSRFRPGCYLVTLSDGRWASSPEERIMILTQRQMKDILSEQIESDQDFSNLFQLQGPQALDKQQTEALATQILERTFQGSFILKRTPLAVPPLSVSYQGSEQGLMVGSDPLSFLVTAFAEECRHLTLWGVEALDFTLIVSKNQVNIRASCILSEPLSELVILEYSDPGTSELPILQALMKEKFRGTNELEIFLTKNSFLISWQMQAGAQLIANA